MVGNVDTRACTQAQEAPNTPPSRKTLGTGVLSIVGQPVDTPSLEKLKSVNGKLIITKSKKAAASSFWQR